MRINKLLISAGVAAIVVLTPANKVTAQDPITIIIKAGVKKVIKAVDLKIQRLQNKTIWLQNAQKVMENTMSKVKLDEISSWAQKQRNLYSEYYDELWKVKSVISYYHLVKEVIKKQELLLDEYKRVWMLFRQDKHFTAAELSYMAQVYKGIVDQSVNNLDWVFLVINSFSTQMSDASRLEIINSAAEGIQTNYNDLKAFNRQGILLSLQRAKTQNDVSTVKQLYGLQ